MHFSSKLIEDAVNQFAQLPGIGKKTALRLVMHVVKKDKHFAENFGSTIAKMRNEIKYCKKCHNVSDHDICNICSNHSRNHQLICVVESLQDVMAIENTNQFAGVFHVLGGIISPVDGIGPDELMINTLVDRVKENNAQEVIMALSSTIEGDTTVYYISKLLANSSVSISTISRGVAFGGELEYTDELTLGRAIVSRLPYDKYLVNNE